VHLEDGHTALHIWPVNSHLGGRRGGEGGWRGGISGPGVCKQCTFCVSAVVFVMQHFNQVTG